MSIVFTSAYSRLIELFAHVLSERQRANSCRHDVRVSISKTCARTECVRGRFFFRSCDGWIDRVRLRKWKCVSHFEAKFHETQRAPANHHETRKTLLRKFSVVTTLHTRAEHRSTSPITESMFHKQTRPTRVSMDPLSLRGKIPFQVMFLH